jgi:inosine/guanosine/xanthosine phosphorylase family protein
MKDETRKALNREQPASVGHPRRERVTPTETATVLMRRTKLRPSLGVVLGSGFQSVIKLCTKVLEINYSAIPGFATPGVPGHEGRLIWGYLDKTPVVLLCGRNHFYENLDMETITFPTRVLAAMGVKTVLLTNAAGGINRGFRAGDFMGLADHINFMGKNPLRNSTGFGMEPFVDLSQVYDVELLRLLKRAGKDAGARLHEGVYLAVSGPSYETPAEIRAFSLLGADAVGMSTVPEAVVARQCGLRVAGLSCITNPAAGLNVNPISHAEVLAMGHRNGALAAEILENFARLYAQS